MKKEKMLPVTEDLYIHKQVGSDRYCYKVFEISKNGRTIKVHPVHWDGPNAWLNEGTLKVDEQSVHEFVWKYKAWREYTNYYGTMRQDVISRRKELSRTGSPYMDPSF